MEGLLLLLFASGDGELRGGAWGAIITAIVGAATYGAIQVMNARHKNSGEVRQWAAKEQDTVIKFQAAELVKLEAKQAEHQARIDKLEEEAQECHRWRAVVTNWFRWAEPQLIEARINLPEFELIGSKEHTPLPVTRPPRKGGK